MNQTPQERWPLTHVPSPSTQPGYQAGYQAGLRKRPAYHPSAAEKIQIVEKWLVNQRNKLLQRKNEIDCQLAGIEAEAALTERGFVFPSGSYQKNTQPQTP